MHSPGSEFKMFKMFLGTPGGSEVGQKLWVTWGPTACIAIGMLKVGGGSLLGLSH